MFYNATETIGVILNHANNEVTGSMVVTLLMILLLVIAMAIMFGIQLEYISILIIPLCISYGAYYSELLAPLATIIFYLSIIFTKNFIFK